METTERSRLLSRNRQLTNLLMILVKQKSSGTGTGMVYSESALPPIPDEVSENV